MDCGILPWLGPDLWIKILTYLVDSPDLIRASAVSWAWREFAYFQFGHPIYSAKAVRFRMGHLKPLEAWSEDFISTYVSPEFPMAQENCLQKFELPEPVLCIGGILQIELLGRVQRQEIDGLFYICVSNVQAVGRQLSPAFDIEILDCSGKCTLKYYPEAVYCMSHARSSKDEPGAPSCLCISTSRLMQRGEELEANHQRQ